MLVIINDSPKIFSKRVRAIIGRYAWRIGRDIWVWPKISIRNDILNELGAHKENISVMLIWPDKSKEFGFKFYIHGDYKCFRTEAGIFNHLQTTERDEV